MSKMILKVLTDQDKHHNKIELMRRRKADKAQRKARRATRRNVK